MNVPCRCGQELGETTGTVNPDDLKPHAAIRLADPAWLTAPTTNKRFDNDWSSDLHARYAWAGILDDPSYLVSRDQGVAGIWIFALIDVQIARTDTRGLDADQHFTGT